MRPGTKGDGLTSWVYMLPYVNAILAIMMEPEKYMREELGQLFSLKKELIGTPGKYFDNKISQVI